MKFKIAAKLILLVVLSILVTAGTIMVVAYIYVDKGYQETYIESVNSDSKVLNYRMDTLRDQYLGTARSNAVRPNVIKGVKTADTELLRKLGQDIIAAKAADFVVFVDQQGKVLARGHDDKAGDSIASQKVVQRAVKDGKSELTFEAGEVVKLSMRAGAPVYEEGKLLGAIILGMNISQDHRFVDEMKSILDGEVTLFFGDTRATTTIKKEDGSRAVGTKMANSKVIETVLEKGQNFLSENNILGREYITAYSPLRDSDSKIMGMIFVGKATESSQKAKLHVIYSILWAALGVSVLLGLIGYVFSRAFSKPILACADFAKKISHGQLEVNLALKSKDETGDLADSLRLMLEKLKEKIAEANANTQKALEESQKAQQATQEAREAKEGAELAKDEGMRAAASRLESIVTEVTQAAEILSEQIDNASQGAKSQSERSSEAAAAIGQMNVSVLEVAKRSALAAETSGQVRSKAQEGATSVHEMVQGIEVVQKKALELRTNMADLGKRAQDIGQVLNVISDIADQTNLLALNAAIEAARAGDAGRGFAVVADEVRKLAEKTMVATTQVSQAVQGIQVGAKANMQSVDQAVTAIDDVTRVAGVSGESLREIVALADEASDQVRAIATAAEEQSAASEEISRSAEEISRISGDTSISMDRSTHEVGELSRQARVLKQLMDELKCGSSLECGQGFKALT